MKTFFVYLFVVTMLLGLAKPVKAQKRKVTKTTVATRTLRPAPKSVSLKATKYEVNAKSVFLGKDYIYYVEDNDNNAVMGINRKTGLTEVIIPGIGNVYEGRRATITYCMECDGRLVLEMKRNFKADGVYVYDGNSLATSKKISESEQLVDCSGKYLLVRCSNGFDRYGLVTDVDLNVKYKWDQNLERTSYHVADDGTIWNWNANGLNGRNLTQMAGKYLYNYDLMSVPYVAQAYAEDEYDTNIECVQLQGNYVYVAIGRRLLRRDFVSNDSKWEEVLKVPVTENNKFRRFVIDSKGNILTQGKASEAYNTQYWAAGAYDTPINLGEYFSCPNTMGGEDKIWWSQLQAVPDADGNVVLWDHGNRVSSIYIYNPNNIVGFAETRGKIVKL